MASRLLSEASGGGDVPARAFATCETAIRRQGSRTVSSRWPTMYRGRIGDNQHDNVFVGSA
eukprot:11216920-Lingulodinium_polyedra.AAC.1